MAANHTMNQGKALRDRLHALRRRARLTTGSRGVSWLLVVGCLTLAGVGAADWGWQLPNLVRAALLVLGLSGVGYIGYRYLYLPMQESLDDLSLALKIEANYPFLNDSLASTVQFLDENDSPAGNSPSMEAEAVRRALTQAAGCDFDRVVDSRGVRAGIASAVGAVGIAIFLFVAYPAQSNTALARLLDPFGSHAWPTKTQLALEQPRSVIGENESFTLTGRVSGIIPEHASLVLRFRGKGEKKFPDYPIDKDGNLEIVLRPDQIRGSFHVRVRANDAVSDWHEVRVLPPPRLVLRDGNPSPQIELLSPKYTGLPLSRKLSPGTGNVPESVFGTKVVLRAQASRPLSRAWIEYVPSQEGLKQSLALAPLGATNILQSMTLTVGAMRVLAPVEAKFERNRARFSIVFSPSVEGSYVLHFRDQLRPTPLQRSREFELRMRSDPAPTVRLLRPSANKDLLMATTSAELPLKFEAEDPTFGLRSVKLRYRTQRAGELRTPDSVWREEVFYDPGMGRVALGKWMGLASLGNGRPPQPGRLEFSRSLFIRDIRHSDGSPLSEGDEVILQACADDFDDITVGKLAGCSHEVRLLIVGRQGLEDEISGRQKQIRNELLELQQKERKAIQKVQQAEARLEQDQPLTEEEQADLLQAEQLQKEIQEGVGNRQGGLRAELARIRETLDQNQLENSLTADRIDDLTREVERLAQNELPEIANRLVDGVRQAEQLGTKGKQNSTEAISTKRELEDKAKQLEEQAKAARLTEENEKKEVARAERLKEETQSPDVKQRLEEEAKRHRRLEEEARTKAERLAQEAQQLRQQANQIPEPGEARKTLETVRGLQENVDRSIQELLARLEPWSSTQELKGETKGLLAEQKALQERAARLQEEGQLAGKNLPELTGDQRAELRKLEAQQKKLQERAQRLLEQMSRMADELREKDPETAQELDEARDEARQENIAGKMRDAQERIAENNLDAAQVNQQEAMASLERMLDNLANRGEREQQRLIKKQQRLQNELKKLREDQDRLQKKIDQANKLPEGQREEALKNLGKEQAALNQRAQQLRNELQEDVRRLRAERANEELDDAVAEMEDQLKRLERGEADPEQQDEILDRLEEAEQQLERSRELAEEQLDREMLERVAKVLKGLEQRQKGLIDEADRIQKEVIETEVWSRGLRRSLRSLARAQSLLKDELTKVGKEDMEQAPVLKRIIERTTEAMGEAASRFDEIFEEEPDPLDLPDAEAKRLQALAHRRLTQILEAIQGELERPQLSRRNEDQEGGGEGGMGGMRGMEPGGGEQPRQAGDSIPPLAQLKLLRLLEVEMKEGMSDLKKAHPDLENLDDESKKQLERLLRQRQDVRELFEELQKGIQARAAAPAGQPAEKPAGDKPEEKPDEEGEDR